MPKLVFNEETKEYDVVYEKTSEETKGALPIPYEDQKIFRKIKVLHLTESVDNEGIKIGGEENYSHFESDGTLVFKGNAVVWDDVRIPGHSVQKGASAPDLAAFLGAGNLLINRFDGGVTTEQIYFTVQLPHSYKEGTDIIPHVHWAPVDTNGGAVKWQLEYSWGNREGGAFPAVTTISTTDTAAGTAWGHQRAMFSAITGTSKEYSSMLVCRLFRNPADGDDTYGSDAAFLEIDFHCENDTVGSREELTK